MIDYSFIKDIVERRRVMARKYGVETANADNNSKTSFNNPFHKENQIEEWFGYNMQETFLRRARGENI